MHQPPSHVVLRRPTQETARSIHDAGYASASTPRICGKFHSRRAQGNEALDSPLPNRAPSGPIQTLGGVRRLSHGADRAAGVRISPRRRWRNRTSIGSQTTSSVSLAKPQEDARGASSWENESAIPVRQTEEEEPALKATNGDPSAFHHHHSSASTVVKC